MGQQKVFSCGAAGLVVPRRTPWPSMEKQERGGGREEQRCPTSQASGATLRLAITLLSHLTEGTAGLWPWLWKPSLAVSCSGPWARALPRCRAAPGREVHRSCFTALPPSFLQSPCFWLHSTGRWGWEQAGGEGPSLACTLPRRPLHRIESL